MVLRDCTAVDESSEIGENEHKLRKEMANLLERNISFETLEEPRARKVKDLNSLIKTSRIQRKHSLVVSLWDGC